MLFIFCLLVFFFYALLLFLAFCFLLFFCKFPVISLVHRERVLLHSCMAQRSQNSQISAGIWIKQGVWKLWDRGDVTPKIALFPRRIGSPLACLYSGQILLVSVVVELVFPGSLYDSVGSPPGRYGDDHEQAYNDGQELRLHLPFFQRNFQPWSYLSIKSFP